MMKRIVVAVAVLGVFASACAAQGGGTQATSTASGANACAKESLPLVNDGTLTIGTGNPAYPPWWEGGESAQNPEWKLNDPYKGKGFEGAVAMAVAQQLGFTPDEIQFVPVPFNKSFAPGPKDFDFNLQQISYTPKRAQAVDFSDGYYQENEALVSVEGSPIANATTIAELKDAKLGAPIGTTSLDLIQQVIQPTQEPAVYDDLNGAIQDLKNGAIDGIVVDLPSSFYITAVQIPDGVVVGQFKGGPVPQEYFGLVLNKDSGLTPCVNQAIAALKADGTLAEIEQKWLAEKVSAPVFSG